MNGNPHKAVRENRVAIDIIGICLDVFPTWRRSCVCPKKLIVDPAHTNKSALNKAWVIRWNKVKFGIFKARLAIMTPSCLKVERATIFFRSCSAKATVPAINIVIEDMISKIWQKFGKEYRNGWKRYRRKTPAVTRVEEWTRAETGVGAAIAAGSHDENGTWALLVIAANIKSMATDVGSIRLIVKAFHWFENKIRAMDKRISTSPIRLVKAVIIPAARDLLFW